VDLRHGGAPSGMSIHATGWAAGMQLITKRYKQTGNGQEIY
jgi:hypothetical protein